MENVRRLSYDLKISYITNIFIRWLETSGANINHNTCLKHSLCLELFYTGKEHYSFRVPATFN